MEQTLAAPDLGAPDLAALIQRLDFLTEQVQLLTEQARLAARRHEDGAELMHDVMPIVNDVFRISVEQLEEVQDYVDLSDLLRLLKRLLRNARNLDRILDQLESFIDLAQTAGLLTDSALEKATDLLQKAEQKGYFEFAKGGARVVDQIVTSREEPIGTSLRSILGQMRDPDVRRGLALTMRALRVIGAQAAEDPQA